MLLANHAEDSRGLVSMIGGAWDSIQVNAPLPNAGQPGAPVTFLHGHLVIRLLLHPAETGRDYRFTILIQDEDGKELAKIEAQARVDKNEKLPVGWNQGANLILPLTGLPIPRFGFFSIVLLSDGQHLGDIPFRVEKNY
jgi:hypothetical protein